MSLTLTNAGASYTEAETQEIGNEITVPNADGETGLVSFEWEDAGSGAYRIKAGTLSIEEHGSGFAAAGDVTVNLPAPASGTTAVITAEAGGTAATVTATITSQGIVPKLSLNISGKAEIEINVTGEAKGLAGKMNDPDNGVYFFKEHIGLFFSGNMKITEEF